MSTLSGKTAQSPFNKKLDAELFNTGCKCNTMTKEDLSKLIDYYRLRVKNFEKERLDWMFKLEGLKMKNEEFHKKEWELRKLVDKITELQQSLSESNIALNQERKKVIHYSNEIEAYKLGTKEDRRRIVQLLQLAEPVEKSIKMFYDRRPEATEKSNSKPSVIIPGNDPSCVSLRKCTTAGTARPIHKKNNKSQTKISVRKTPSDARQNIIKTIMLSSGTKENYANEENESLKKQKEEIIALYENIILKMEEDGKLREEEFRLQANNMNNKLAELQKRKKNIELLNTNITKQYLDVKYDVDINNKKLHEENGLVKLQNQALANSLKDVAKKASIEREVSKHEYKRKTKEVTNSLRKQVRSKEDNANLVKEQYRQIQRIYAEKVNELETKLADLKNKYNLLESQQKGGMDECIAELKKLRECMKGKERYVTDLKKKMIPEQEEGMEEENNNVASFLEVYDNLYSYLKETNEDFFIQGNQIDERLDKLTGKLKAELRNFKKMSKNPKLYEEQKQKPQENQMNEQQYNQYDNNNNNNFNSTGNENQYVTSEEMPHNMEQEQGYQGGDEEEQQQGNYDEEEQANNEGDEEEQVNYGEGERGEDQGEEGEGEQAEEGEEGEEYEGDGNYDEAEAEGEMGEEAEQGEEIEEEPVPNN